MGNKLRVVLDTNVLMVSILPKHKYFWIYESLIQGKYDLLLSNEMLTEYSEVLDRKYGIKQSDATLDFLTWLPNVDFILPTIHWNLIEVDPDDNKFVDCAIFGGADFIVTHDHHYDILQHIPFPSVKTIKIPEFQEILEHFSSETTS
jgi:uncharacterized protein